MRLQPPKLIALDQDDTVLRQVSRVFGGTFLVVQVRNPSRAIGLLDIDASIRAIVTEQVMRTADGVELLGERAAMKIESNYSGPDGRRDRPGITGEQFDEHVERVDRPVPALAKAPCGRVGVQRHEQRRAQLARAREIGDMSAMQEVENAVGEDDPSAARAPSPW